MILAWVLRDFATPILEKIPCKHRGSYFLRALASFRRLLR